MYTIEQIIKICSEHDITYIDGFTRTDKSFNCLCRCGAEWTTWLASIRNNGSCIKCTPGRKNSSHKEIANELLTYGLELLVPYKNVSTKLTYLCSCGTIGNTYLSHIRSGIKCGHCVEMNHRQIFKDYGCEVITYETASKITYSCKCGKVYTKRFNQWFNSGKLCNSCRNFYYIKDGKIPTRKNLYLWKKQVLIRDNFRCVNCAQLSNLEIHHIEAYSIKPDLADVTTNGITLCYTCHRLLHRKFGLNVGLQNLLTEFKIDFKFNSREEQLYVRRNFGGS